jgi:hypothetical protein
MQKAGDKNSQAKTHPKTDVRYWRERVYKPVTVRGERRVTSEHYAVQLRYRSPRRTLSLSTANREEAAQRARRMYLDLVAGGWELLLKNHRPNEAAERSPGAQRDAARQSVITFGDYINLLRSKHLIATRTLEGYIPRLRRIVSEIKHIAPNPKRYAAKGGRLWRDKVDAVPLASVTPDDVRRWKQRAIDKAEDNEPLRRQYTISVNSTMRQARSLFSERKVLRHHSPSPALTCSRALSSSRELI